MNQNEKNEGGDGCQLRRTKTEFGKGITGEEARPNEFSTTAAISAALGTSKLDREREGKAK